MSFKTTFDIRVAGFRFRSCASVRIESSWEELTDKATLVVPRKLSFEGQSVGQGESLFKKGMEASIFLGYDFANKLRFNGYISQITPANSLEFELQDEMWNLKQRTFTASYEQVTLKQLLTDHCPVPFNVPDISLGQYRITKASLVEVFKDLRDNYGIYTFMRDGQIWSGLAYWPELANEHRFKFGRNIIDGNSLSYMREDDVKLKVTAISMLPDNQKIEIEIGDEDGETRTLHYYNISEQELRRRATAEMENLRYEGFRGHFTAFGEPVVQHQDIVHISDPQNEDRDGSYQVKKVTATSGNDGYFQTIEIDRKV
jgi:hypothetical protein